VVLPAALPPHPEPEGSTSEPPTGEACAGQELSTRQAHEAAYRLVARYYDYERIPPILQLLDALWGTGDGPASNDRGWAVSAVWEDCVQETLDGAPLPELSPPWDS
jgi:hypothetical protein